MGRAAIPAVFLAFAALYGTKLTSSGKLPLSINQEHVLTIISIQVPSVNVANINITPGTIKYGFLGWCYNDQCSDKSLGYRLEDPINQLPGVNITIDNKAVENITYALVLNPVCGLLSLLVSLFGLLAIRGGRITAIFLTIFEGFTALVGIVTLALNVALFKVFQNIMNDRLDIPGAQIDSKLDNAEWLSVAAAGCLIVGSVLSLLGICFGRSSTRRRDISYV
ncbi:hypothetical protein E3Q06_00115 [Wallemia mellicola]|nr:hypothetical protein E3Q21_00114 [Wallemia mellicola]TIB92714.1 hypothetical protein E3Q20_00115 [Wallemia mellicola]TIC44493.1 hypothetical protein E3Q07_00115 [Wallemia mellicola]TIC53680.1 hypothetical protein E3Q06_00115 [Wallemia mellicola]